MAWLRALTLTTCLWASCLVYNEELLTDDGGPGAGGSSNTTVGSTASSGPGGAGGMTASASSSSASSGGATGGEGGTGAAGAGGAGGSGGVDSVVWINEIHYDNDLGDVDEGVELAGTAGLDLSGYSVIAYNGSNGQGYSTTNLSGTIPSQQNGFGALWFAIADLQNGSPDGLALIAPSNDVVQFLSYEGSFVASDGPANGTMSQDIGVSEEDEPAFNGTSLQLQGTGSVYGDFTWAAMIATTHGSPNTGQQLGP